MVKLKPPTKRQIWNKMARIQAEQSQQKEDLQKFIKDVNDALDINTIEHRDFDTRVKQLEKDKDKTHFGFGAILILFTNIRDLITEFLADDDDSS